MLSGLGTRQAAALRAGVLGAVRALNAGFPYDLTIR